MSATIPAATEQIDYADLYARWERGNWSATDIDFTQDRIDWNEKFTPEQRRGALWLYTLFFHGEDTVADTLGPYIEAAPLERISADLRGRQVGVQEVGAFREVMTRLVLQSAGLQWRASARERVLWTGLAMAEYALRFGRDLDRNLAELLQELTGGALSSDDVDVLIARTEGWVTGLRCAASSASSPPSAATASAARACRSRCPSPNPDAGARPLPELLPNETNRRSVAPVSGGEFRIRSIAFESAKERAILIDTTAPHLVRPLGSLIPLTDDISRRNGLLASLGIRAGDMLRVAAGQPAFTVHAGGRGIDAVQVGVGVPQGDGLVAAETYGAARVDVVERAGEGDDADLHATGSSTVTV